MVLNMKIAISKDAATEPNMQVESVSDIVPKQTKRFAEVQSITSKSTPSQTGRTTTFRQVL
jgi:hypothetical protein